MNGPDKIINKILEDARLEADEIIKSAEKEAILILEKAKTNAKNVKDDSIKKAASKASFKETSSISLANSEGRQIVLKAKQKLLDMVFEKALKDLLELPDEKYFSVLLKLLKQNAPKDKAFEILLSNDDFNKAPASFKETVSKDYKDAEIAVSPTRFEGGLIIKHGNIFENCTFKAILDLKRFAIEQEISKILFKD